jgi:hypothetical protein
MATKPRRKTSRTKRVNDAFDVLWSLLPHPPDSVVRVFTRSGDTRDGDFTRNAAEIRNFAKINTGKNVYVAPNPTNSTVGSRHSASEVTHWSYFLIDMDPIEEPNDPEKALEEALLWIGEWMGLDFKYRRPIIIDSGRGMQAWIRLEDIPMRDTPVRSADDFRLGMDRSTARRANGYWLKRLDEKLGVANGCRIDTSVSDLPRVMRCPGTINMKTGRQAKFVVPSDVVFTGLAQRLVIGTPKRFLVDPEPPEGVAAGQPWQSVYVHLTRMAQGYLSLGQEEPGRHKVMWHTAKKLQELGVTKREARSALRWANALKGKEAELPDEQVEHALNTAYGD